MKDEKKVKETEEKGKEIKEEQLKNVAGVKIESNIASAKLKQKRGSGRLTP